MGGNKGREVGGSYTTSVDIIAAEKKKTPKRGGTNQNGGGYPPINQYFLFLHRFCQNSQELTRIPTELTGIHLVRHNFKCMYFFVMAYIRAWPYCKCFKYIFNFNFNILNTLIKLNTSPPRGGKEGKEKKKQGSMNTTHHLTIYTTGEEP